MASLIGLLPDGFWRCALAAAALSPSEGAIKLLPPSVQVTGAGWETCIYWLLLCVGKGSGGGVGESDCSLSSQSLLCSGTLRK